MVSVKNHPSAGNPDHESMNEQDARGMQSSLIAYLRSVWDFFFEKTEKFQSENRRNINFCTFL